MTEHCTQIGPELVARSLGLLGADADQALDSHLAECDQCLAIAGEAERVLEDYRLPDVTPKPNLWDALESRIAAADAGNASGPALRVVLTCTYCRDELAETIYCAGCLAPHHSECFAEHGHCSAPGCEETRTVAPIPTRPRRRSTWRRWGGWGLGLGLVAAAAFAGDAGGARGWLLSEAPIDSVGPAPTGPTAPAAPLTPVAPIPEPEPPPPPEPIHQTTEAAGAWLTDAPSPRPVVYPLPPERPRLIHVASNRVTDTRVRPHGLIYEQGKLLFADMGTGALGVADVAQGTVNLVRPTQEALVRPTQITLGPGGERLVLDRARKAVVAWSAAGAPLWTFAAPDREPLAIAASGEVVFVSDQTRHQILVLELGTGDVVRTFGAEDQLGWPAGLTIDPEGNLLVSDMLTCRVLRFTPEGRLLQSFGEAGTSRGNLARPKGIACDRAGRIYVVDAVFHNVQIFDPKGRLLLSFGEPGSERGSLRLPAQITIDYANVDLYEAQIAQGHDVEYLIAVTNLGGPRSVMVYGFLKNEQNEGGTGD